VVERREQLPFGDVAFSVPGETMVLFARANLVIMLRNAGSELTSMTPIAEQFDSSLISKQDTGRMDSEVQRFQPNTEGYKPGDRIPLGVGAIDQLPDDKQWYKLFSGSGEVLLDKGTLVYEYKEEGPQEITIVVVNPGRATANENRKLFLR
jgi:hypothetical protein